MLAEHTMAEHRVEIALQSSEKKETAADSQRVKDTESIDREQSERGDSQRETDTKFIARVPEHVHKEMKEMKAFVPQVVSLGPFHHGSPELAKHETLKGQHLLPKGRLSSFEKLVDDIISQKIKLNAIIQRWYSITERECPHEDERELGRMMARDGLFLLRFLKANTGRRKLFEPKSLILEDIMKLENQIPFFVLKMVFEWEVGTVKDFSSTLKRSCQTLCPLQLDVRAQMNMDSNLLGFMYENIIGSSDHSTDSAEPNRPQKMTSISRAGDNQMSKNRKLRTAAELEGKGVKFAAIKPPVALNKIRFDDTTCTFYLPIIKMDSTTDVVMGNLLAFELFVSKKRTKPLWCYMDMMERLINNVEDVGVLITNNIIENDLKDYEEVVTVWNAMRYLLDQDVKDSHIPIHPAIQGVTDFYSNKYRTMWAEFKKKYFSRPWVVVALVGGIIQLFLSLLQTILAWEQSK